MDYMILVAESIKELEEEVKDYMRIGYIPTGGVTITNTFLCQAVTRVKK